MDDLITFQFKLLFSIIQFTLTIVLCFVYVSISPYYSVSHKWLTGLEFCIPPEDKDLDKLDTTQPSSTDSTSRRRRQRSRWFNEQQQVKKNEIELKVATIEDNTLTKHLFFEEYDQLVLVLICCVFNFLFSELWSHCLGDEESARGGNMISSAMFVFAAGFSLKTMLSVVHKLGLQSYELKLTVFVAILSLVLSLGLLEISDSVLDCGLLEGYSDFMKQFNNIMQQNNQQTRLQISSFGTYKFILSLICAIITSVIFFPGFRLARSYYEMAKYTPRPYHATLSTISIVLPAFVFPLWIKPICKDFLIGNPSIKEWISITPSMVDTVKVLSTACICTLRLILLRPYMQSFLATSVGWAELLLNGTSNKDRAKNIKFKILGIYSYLCVAAIQILAPTVLLLSFTFILKWRGLWDVSLFPFCYNSLSTAPSPPPPPTDSSSISTAASTLLFTPLFYKGTFSFLCLWTMISWFGISMFALIYERNQSIFVLSNHNTQQPKKEANMSDFHGLRVELFLPSSQRRRSFKLPHDDKGSISNLPSVAVWFPEERLGLETTDEVGTNCIMCQCCMQLSDASDNAHFLVVINYASVTVNR